MTTPLQSAAGRLAMVANLDLSGVMRGRSVPAIRTAEVLADGLPWVPTNIMLSALDSIPAKNPFGPMGEVRLFGDPAKKLALPARADRPALDLYLADIRNMDGSDWMMCPRGQLRRALQALEARGLTLKVGFEHELYLTGLQEVPTAAFSLAGTRAVSAVSDEVQAILATAGTRLDQFAAEFGNHQFEIASPVAHAGTAADHAVFAREVIRDVALSRGLAVTFAPKPDAAQPGSGVHIHFSLWDSAGNPVTAHNSALTPTAGAFTAGILKHFSAIMAFTTPTPNSFSRLLPSNWVGVFACLGERNRETAIRFCPRRPGDDNRHAGASLEFRVADASANPHLALAAIVRAGLAGIEADLSTPPHVEGDPATIPQDERTHRGIASIPTSPVEVMEAADAVGPAWFGDDFWPAYRAVLENCISDAERPDYVTRFRRSI